MKLEKLLAAIALCVPVVVQAGFQEFTVHYELRPVGKVSYSIPKEMVYYMDGNRMRQDMVTEKGRLVIIQELKGNKYVHTMLDMDQKTYMRTEGEAEPNERFLFQLPRGEESPCRNNPAFSCKRVGKGRFKGYDIIKWQVTEKRDGKPSVYWYAPALGVFLKSESAEMVMTAIRIEDRAPPASVFEPPAGFRQTSYGAWLGGQAAKGMSSPGEPAAGPQEAPASATASVEANEGTGAEPDAGEVVEGLKDAVKSLFGK